jgi:hypothetical protein
LSSIAKPPSEDCQSLHGEEHLQCQAESNENWSDFDAAIILYKDLKNCCEEGPNKSKESMSSELTTVTESSNQR